MRTVIVSVTAEDIRDGLACNGLKCPIAKAMYRLGHEHWEIIVPEITSEEGDFTTMLPPEAERFACMFDNGEPVEPFYFTIELPE